MREPLRPDGGAPDDRFVGAVHQHALLFDDDGEVLLVQRADDERWTLPGAPLAADADPEMDLWEPIADQIGVEVRVVMPVWTGADRGDLDPMLAGDVDVGPGADDDGDVAPDDADDARFVVVYLCEPVGGVADVDLGEGFRNHGWFPPATVDEDFVEDEVLRDGLRKAVALREAMKR